MGLPVPPPSPSLSLPTPSPYPFSFPDCIPKSISQTYHDSLHRSLHQFQHFSFVLTDPSLPGHPIVFASHGFLLMSGYLAEEVLGRNPKFLHGADTDRRTVLEIRDALREERECRVTILNYTKQGWPFWNMFHMSPLFSKADGRVIHFVGVQTPLSSCIVAPVRNPCSLAVGCDPKGSSFERQGTRFAAHGVYNVLESRADCFSCIKHKRVAGTDLVHEQKCEVLESDKQKTIFVMRSVIDILEQSSKLKGFELSQTRDSIPAAVCSRETVISSALMVALTKIQQSFVLSNPHLPGMPIVHASDMFLRLTGYCRSEVLGRNCRFMQGADTDSDVIHQIRECIKVEKACTVRILNYRKDRTPFWNLLHVSPVRSNGGKVAFFVGVQLELTSASVTEFQSKDVAPRMEQLGAVGAVKVAVRSLQGPGLRRVQECLLCGHLGDGES